MAGSVGDLSRYRFSCAEEDLKYARIVLREGGYKLALNRSYYAIFHALQAVNILDSFDSSKHSGAIAHFNQYHVKTGDFDREASKIIRNASELREQADYEDFFIASYQQAAEQIAKAEEFYKLVKDYLLRNGIVS